MQPCFTCPSFPPACPTRLSLSLVLHSHQPDAWRGILYESTFSGEDTARRLDYYTQTTGHPCMWAWFITIVHLKSLVNRFFFSLKPVFDIFFFLGIRNFWDSITNHKMTEKSMIGSPLSWRQSQIWCGAELIQNQTLNITICSQWHITPSNSSKRLVRMLLQGIKTVLKQHRVDSQFHPVSSFYSP